MLEHLNLGASIPDAPTGHKQSGTNPKHSGEPRAARAEGEMPSCAAAAASVGRAGEALEPLPGKESSTDVIDEGDGVPAPEGTTPLYRNGFGSSWLLTFDYRLFSMHARRGTGLTGVRSQRGIPPTGKEAPLNRKELVDSIQKHTSVARADVDRVLGSLIQHTQVAVKKGERVSLVGFGTFERQDRRARTARNPRSGEPVKVKATKVPRFRAGQGFKDVVSGKAAAPKLTAAKATGRGSATKASTGRSSRSRAAARTTTSARASTGKSKGGKKR
jgi:DNA-binding protein HU-beta